MSVAGFIANPFANPGGYHIAAGRLGGDFISFSYETTGRNSKLTASDEAETEITSLTQFSNRLATNPAGLNIIARQGLADNIKRSTDGGVTRGDFSPR